MTDLLFAVLLVGLSLCGIVVRKTYYHLPLRELKRQAKKKDSVESVLYRAVAFGESLRLLLLIFIVLTGAGGLVLLLRATPSLVSFVEAIVVLWVAFWWLPNSRVTNFGARITVMVTPTIVWLLGYIHPLLHKIVSVARRRIKLPQPHTGLYERSDLLKVIDQQQVQVDNRLSSEELDIARRALEFGDHKVGDALTSRKQIKAVLATELVGPVFIDEVHKSDQDYILVKESPKGGFVGILERRMLGLDSTGKVSDVMRPVVYYLHENDTLTQALHAFFTTNYPLFVVVNSFEEYVGVITIENILRQLLGHVPGDEFDQYTDPAAVAARHQQIESEDETSVTPEKVLE